MELETYKKIVFLFILLNCGIIYDYYTNQSPQQVSILQSFSSEPTSPVSPGYHINGYVESPSEVCMYGKDMKVMVAQGNSMLPVSRNNTYTIVEKSFTYENLSIGDIVVYRRNDSIYDGYVDHRLIWMNSTHFVARGDNNYYDDDMMPLTAIKGIVVGILY